MQDVTSRTRTVIAAESAPEPATAWQSDVGELLTRAAVICAQHDLDIDAFMRGAWHAYVESRPGFKQYLEDLQLRTQLDEIRKAGQMGKA